MKILLTVHQVFPQHGSGTEVLTLETARCLRAEDGTAPFDAAVWVSDRDRPGTTSLSTVLDEIARFERV